MKKTKKPPSEGKFERFQKTNNDKILVEFCISYDVLEMDEFVGVHNEVVILN